MQGAISVIPSECLKGRASVPGSGWRGDRGATHKVKEGAEFFKETSVSSNRTASSGSWMRYGVE